MTLRKIRGIYHASVTGKGGRVRSISTGCSDRTQALKVIAESGVADLERAARAGRLTREAIGHITTGRRLTMAKALEPYRDYMKTIALSQNTITNNLTTLRCWLREMTLETLNPASITAEHISKWINDPASESKRSTRGVNLSCIRAFFSYMAANGWIVVDVSKLVKVDFGVMSHAQKESKVRLPFTEDELATLLEYLENNNETFWRFAVLCARENGLRLGDICNLTWKCFTEEPHALVVWTDKTNKRLVHKMSPVLEGALGEIISTDEYWLFPEQHALNMDVSKRATLSCQFTRICERLGIKGKSFHHLRHRKLEKDDINSMAKKLAKSLSLEQMKTLLGHSSTSTTEKYAH